MLTFSCNSKGFRKVEGRTNTLCAQSTVFILVGSSKALCIQMNIFMYIKEHILSLVVLKSGVLCHLTFKDTFIYSRPRVADRRRLKLIMMPCRVSGDEVPKKLKQNVITVRILTLIVAFHDDSSPDMSPIKWRTITKLGVCPRPQT